MTEDHSDFLIKSAALLAKDLLVEHRLLTNPTTIEADSDDDLDLFFYSQWMKKRKISEKNKSHAGSVTKGGGVMSLKRHSSSNKRGAQGPPMNHLFLKFLQECEDITFENQFKMTRTTFQVSLLCRGGSFYSIQFSLSSN